MATQELLYDATGLRLLAAMNREAAAIGCCQMLAAQSRSQVNCALQVIREAGVNPWTVLFAGDDAVATKSGRFLLGLGQTAVHLARCGHLPITPEREAALRELRPALPLLVPLALDRSYPYRYMAVAALGLLGARGLKNLKHMAGRDDYEVHTALAQSLGRIGPKGLPVLAKISTGGHLVSKGGTLRFTGTLSGSSGIR